MVEAAKILTYLSSNKQRLQDEYHLTKIGLFGSVVRGDNHAGSDIDIVVEFEPNTNDLYMLKINLKNEIQSHFNAKVDVCRLKYIKPIFKNQIQSEVKYV
jgi:predicted nucleotidyltransferase